MKNFALFLIALVTLCLPVRASETVSDSVRVSLLTCEPGSEIYSLFGHTALRYENPSRKQDWVFNYGVFSFKTPNFVMRFVRGETDYQLGVVPFAYFEAEYGLRGSSVYQQELNLTDTEKARLFALLEENYLPKNRTYRYNYFYDNCTTRARDKVEEAIEGKVVYPEGDKSKTFRDIIRQYTDGHEWSAFGIDLCLGAEADEPIDERRQMFAPFYMLDFAREAMIHRADTVMPLVKKETKAVDVSEKRADVFEKHAGVLEKREDVFLPSPMACAVAWLVMTLLVMMWSLRRGKIPWLWDILLFGAQGVAGCIIAFLFFFSVHPTVGSNWLLVMLNPLPLLYLPVMVYKGIKGKKDVFHGINATVLTLFIVIMPFLPQKFNATIVPLAANLLVCSIAHLIIYNRMKK